MNINIFQAKNRISPGKISRLLKNPSCGECIEYFDEIDSTNEYLKRKDHAPDWSVVIAGSQSAGKGRMDRSFYSPNGGIYMSILLRPTLSLRDASFLTVVAAVAVKNALTTLSGNDVKIKWINDLFLRNKKICGILCESSCSAGKGAPDYMIIGIGINLYGTRFPDELNEIAGTLSDRKIDRNQVIAAILDEFYRITHPIDKKWVLTAYKDASCVLGAEVEVYNGDTSYSATAVDIDEDAHLIVRTKEGSLKNLCAGEVRIKL